MCGGCIRCAWSISFLSRIGFWLCVFVPDFQSGDLRKKRLAERLMQGKLLMILGKMADQVVSPGRRAVLHAGAVWLTVQSGNIFNGL